MGWLRKMFGLKTEAPKRPAKPTGRCACGAFGPPREIGRFPLSGRPDIKPRCDACHEADLLRWKMRRTEREREAIALRERTLAEAAAFDWNGNGGKP